MCYCLIKSCFCFSLEVGTGIMFYLKLLYNILVYYIITCTPYSVIRKQSESAVLTRYFLRIFLTIQTYVLLLGILRFHYNIIALFLPLVYVHMCQIYLLVIDVLIIISAHYGRVFDSFCEEIQRSQEENSCLFIAILFRDDFATLRLIFNIFAEYVFYSYYKIVILRDPILVPCGFGICECDVSLVKMTEEVEEANNNEPAPSDNNNVSKAPDKSEENVISEVPTRRRFSGFGLRIPCSSFWVWCVGLTASSRVGAKGQASQKVSMGHVKLKRLPV